MLRGIDGQQAGQLAQEVGARTVVDPRRSPLGAGTLATPVTLAKATAPLGAAALYAATSSYAVVMTAIGSACLIAATGISATD